MPLPSKRDPEELRRRLEAWFTTVLPEGGEPRVGPVSIPDGTGMSSETLIVDVAHQGAQGEVTERFVVRMQPDMADWPVFPTYDLEAQQRAMALVAERSDVPVPRVRWSEPDPAAIGAPFFVMERVEGRALPDMPPYVFGSWVDELEPAEQDELQRAAVETLARLHAIDLAGAEIDFLGPPALAADGDSLGAQLAEQRAYYDWARGDERYPVIERLFDWLDERRPSEPGPTVLNWGDARPGNILFQGTTPAAVLDWEMATVGPAEVDVGWMIFLHAFFQDLAERFGLPGLPGFCLRDDVVAVYEQAAGRPVRDLDWYEAYAALRFAIISLRTSARSVEYGDLPAPDEPEGLIMHKHLLDRILDGTYWS